MSVIFSKTLRFAARYTDRAILPDLQESIISFSFDDCPKSAITNGLPMLEAEGWRATVFVACGLCDTTNHLGLHIGERDIIDLHNRGHEIGDHTFSHISGNSVNLDDFLNDVERNQQTLEKLGIPRSRHFAYPFGHVTPPLKTALSKKFKTLRGVISPQDQIQDASLLKAARLYSNDSVELALDEITKAKDSPKWLHLFTHDVRDNPSKFGCTRDDFAKIIKAVIKSGLPVMTVDKAYRTIMEARES